MKKILKSLLAITAAFLMVFSLGTAVNAADDNTGITVTIEDSAGNTAYGTYIAYKLFNVTAQIKEGNTDEKTYKYSIVDTGSNHNNVLADEKVYTTLGLGIKEENTKQSTEIAEDVLSKLSELNDDTKFVKFANALGKLLNGKDAVSGDVEFTLSSDKPTASLAPGYYVVLEKKSEDNESYTAAILNTAVAVDDELTLTSKETTPTVEKKVEEINDTTGKTKGWQDAADYDGGDTIKYRLKGTLPSDYDSYDKYTYIFTDTLSKGLDVDTDSIKVYAVASNEVTNEVESKDLLSTYTDITNYFTRTKTNYNGEKTSYEGGTLLTISCEDLKDADSNKDKDESGAVKGKNVLKSNTAIIVRYTATLDKEKAVIGADGNPNEVTLTYSNNPNDETGNSTHTTPEDKVTVYTYQVVVNKTDGENPLSGANFTLEKLDKDGNSLNPKKTYDYTHPNDKDSTFIFSDLDAGTYKLVESKVPDGYKAASDLIFKVEATYDPVSDDPKLTSLVVKDNKENVISTIDNKVTDKTFYLDTATNAEGGLIYGGTMTTTVVNTPGSKLPSTGGIGTTMFYVFGGGLVAVAAALLIAKKRASAE